ncbi:MAG: 3-deoxy-D-manno-octulosonic acid transferase, partial [Muribaculaceae bacterium]|nr:3-deoxy-D-manno-octulosonic acid transferase [Muribaculaceae bacterium]
MNPLYNAGIALFKGALSLAALRSPKIKEMRRGQRETLGDLEATRHRVAPEGFDLWFHAASLGEFEQGRPLMERLKREHPDLKILLTFFSPSGYRVRHNYPGADAVFYLPLDTPAEVRAFLDAAAPRRAFFIKYEFWGNYLAELRRRGIPTYIISAIFRPGQRFFRRGGGVFRRMLTCFDHLYVQDENSRRLLASIGIDKVTVAGDTRFDRVTDIRKAARELPAPLATFIAGSHFTIVAGSSWEPDEDILFPWLEKHPEARLVIAPHEFDERRLARMLERLGKNARLLSQLKTPEDLPADCRAVIVDSFGLLSSLYRVASVAIIGGGFGSGIHNINEAAVYGIPVIFGPRHEKFKEASDLITAGGAFEVKDAASLAAVLDLLAADPHARDKAGRAAGDYIA